MQDCKDFFSTLGVKPEPITGVSPIGWESVVILPELVGFPWTSYR